MKSVHLNNWLVWNICVKYTVGPFLGLYLDIGPDRDQVTKSALWKASTGYDPVWSEFEMMATIATEKVPIFSKPVSHRLISLSLSYFVVCPFKDFL